MRTFVIGTAGHVDHGKTRLVEALTGVDTDRLPEERRRGISIELGFAPWRVAGDVLATIVDVPGHRRLVHTMIAGASGIELVLFVIAADEGVMPQTREHARVCEQLGIREAIVVLTKTDLVDRETVAIAEAEARELLARRFALDVVTCSARTGDGLVELTARVGDRLRRLPRPLTREPLPARLWIDRVLTLRGAGTVVTGTLVAGEIATGAELVLFGSGGPRRVLVRGLHVHDEARERVLAPSRLAVNLAVPAADVRRGDLLTSDDALDPTMVLDVAFRGPTPRRGAALSLHAGTTHVAAKVTRTDALDDGEALLRLVLGERRPLRGGDRVLLRGPSGEEGSLVGGGTVLDAHPHPRSRSDARRALLRALRAGDAGAALTGLLREVAPHPLSLASLNGRLAIEGTELARVAAVGARAGALVALQGTVDSVVTRATLGELADQVRAWVREHARAAPLDRGLPLATLRAKLAAKAGSAVAEAAIRSARARRSADDEGAVEVLADVVVPARRPPLDPALAGLLGAVRVEVDRASGRGASLARLAEGTHAAADRVRGALAALEREGSIVRAGELWFAARVVAEVRAVLEGHLARAGRVTAAELKVLAGLPRNQAVLLLEHFDRTNVTRRVGDARVLARAD